MENAPIFQTLDEFAAEMRKLREDNAKLLQEVRIYEAKDIKDTSLKQELDSLRRDKERLDWLFLNWRQFELLRTTNTILYARQVIDAAIAQERKGEK